MDKKLFSSRKDLYLAGLHNSYQKGIGRAKDGSDCMSIVLSGGYEDDEDNGQELVYTGEGGRDPSTGLQIADQELKGGNLDLLKAYESGNAVYVTRGSSHRGSKSPISGYEFDGKYLIESHWIEKGKSGFDIVRFRLRKQEALLTDVVKMQLGAKQAERVEYTATRIVRDTKTSKDIKALYSYRCQVCRLAIKLPSGGEYTEGAHIKPLGNPHNGPDTSDNILCLCPNHHVMFDKYCFSINEDYSLEGLDGFLHVLPTHHINGEYLTYHSDNYRKHIIP